MGTNKSKMVSRIDVRCTIEEKNELRRLADRYARGNLSAYIIERALNAPRKYISNDDVEMSERRVSNAHPPIKDDHEVF